MAVNTKDLARICKVSRGTVDRALNNRPGIKEETKKMILQAANDFGYRPDLIARSLVKKNSMSIGVIIFDVKNRFFAQLLNAIELEAKKMEYFSYIALTEKDKEKERRIITQLKDRRVDGLIILPVNEGPEYEKFIHELNIPVVFVGNKLSDDHHYIWIDDHKAAQDAAMLIVNKGYERIIFICPPVSKLGEENVYAQKRRLDGFEDFFTSYRYPAVEYITVTDKKYEEKIVEYIKSGDKKTAIFCSSDYYTLKVMKLLRQIDLTVPDDVGIISFDHVDTFDFIVPELTAVYNPVEKIGISCVQSLIKLINREPVAKTQLLEHSMIYGKTL